MSDRVSLSHPLAQQTILVTRSAEQSPTFTNLLHDRGAEVVEMPTLEIVPPSSWDDLDQAIADLKTYDWLILTSANAVNFFFDRWAMMEGEAIALDLKIAVVGKKTAQFLNQRGFEANFTPPDFVADSLVTHFPEALAGLKILFPRVESGGREVLVQSFTQSGAIVTEVAAYQSRCPETAEPAIISALRDRKISIVTFASSKTVQHFVQLVSQALGETWPTAFTEITIASIGPQTSKTCHALLGRVDVEAKEYTLEGLVDAIESSMVI